jgi:hypothetical protein
MVPFLLVLAFISIIRTNILFLGEFIFGFTLVVWKAFILHAFHHFHETPTNVQDVNLLINDLPNPKFQSMKEV